MAPHRVLWRAMSGPEVARAVRSATGTRTVRIDAGKRQAQVQRATKPTAAKRDPYAAALAIPAQNRAAAAKMARAAQPAAGKSVPVRRKDGKFDGRRSMRADDLTVYERAQGGYVDPALRPRSARARRQS